MVAGSKIVAATVKDPVPVVVALIQFVFSSVGDSFFDTQTPRADTAELPCEVTFPPKLADVLVMLDAVEVVTVGSWITPAWVMVTVLGEPVAPVAVTVMVAVRWVKVVFAAMVTTGLPGPEPEVGATTAQVWSDAAVQLSIPPPVLVMVRVTVPPAAATLAVGVLT
jgi:hypothetical protein